jgi:hypothetical protein
MPNSSSNERSRPGWPKLRYRAVPGGRVHEYEVLIQRRPRGPQFSLGTVARFGSLPSMRGWLAQPEGGEWTRPRRQARADAAADLVAATCRYCAGRGAGVEHLLCIAEVDADGLVAVVCAEHAEAGHMGVRPGAPQAFTRPRPGR